MKNIYFVQAAKSCSDTTVYLPYASGCLIAYAMRDTEIASGYTFNDIIFMRENVEEVLNSFYEPYLVAFSCCLWNIEYSKVLAQKIKEIYPSCLIAFGGHSVADNMEFLDKYPYADFAFCGEGERSFAALLKCLLHGQNLCNIDNLAYRTVHGTIKNQTFNDYAVESYPSPYLTGIFDKIFEKYPSHHFHAIIETNRGCPYNCAFCEWCYTKDIRYFPLDRVKEEINWMSENKIEYCYCADANFGISSRDVEIAQFVVSARKNNGYPGTFRPTYAKNSNDIVFEAGRILNLNGADKGVTISYQSLNEVTLALIGRKELSLSSFSELELKYSSEGIPTYTELILGLPGETYESFCGGLCKLIEAGQHNSIAVYQCQIYANTLMHDIDFQKIHGIITATVPVNGAHYKSDFNGTTEYYDVVIGTAAMNTSEWVKANMFSIVLQAFHNMGLLRCFALYLFYENGIGYYEFYNLLLSYIRHASGTFIQKLFTNFEMRLNDTKTGDWIYSNDKFGDIGWYFEEGAFMELVYSGDVLWEELLPFFNQFHIGDNVLTELLQYQKFIIRRPGIVSASAVFSFGFFNYFDEIYSGNYHALKNQKCRINIASGISVSTWEEYALKIVLSGKRRGETLFTNEKGSVTVKDVS